MLKPARRPTRRLRPVRLFRRREETLNDRLLREAGYGPDGTKLADVEPAVPEASSPLLVTPQLPTADGVLLGPLSAQHGWDAVAAAEAPELRRDAYEFATVPNGSLIVDESCDEDLSPLADGVERQLQAPYRAVAARQDDRFWLVSARRIQVAQLPVDGDELELSSVGGRRVFAIDGRTADAAGAPRELVRLGEARGSDYAVRATRIDADLWEVDADPL
jgi:hypothetical protein